MGEGALSPPEALRQAVAQHQAGRLDEAERLYGLVLSTHPRQVDALHLLGVVAMQRGRFNEAERLIGQAVALKPDFVAAHYNLGNARRQAERLDEALASYDRAVALKPDYGEAHFNRANTLAALRRLQEALAGFDAAIRLLPQLAEAHNNRGTVLKDLGRPADALDGYDRATALKPDFAEAHYNGGVALEALRRPQEALARFDRALALKPAMADALNRRGNVLLELRRPVEAAEGFRRLVAIAPDHPYAIGRLHHAMLHCCDWSEHAALTRRVEQAVLAGKRAAMPFSFLAVSASPAAHRRCAETFAADQFPAAAVPLWRGERYTHDRIRLAYLSADFRDHPVPILLAGVLERHDRARFQTIGVSLAPDDGSRMRRRLEGAFETFIDATAMSDRAVAEKLRAMEADILVDISGFTQGVRTGILAQRPAPVQVNYLGFPGTMGAPYIDYILADATVVPPGESRHFSEQVVHLPDAYQANDDRRAIATAAPTRAEAGLPPQGCVFCCFNKNYKIMPDIFDVWMRLLRRVEGSVLWLLEAHSAASDNLRREAAVRGVDPARLVFAPRVRPDQHLARHAMADLFLDTLPYNAHTTASDALWAGLPLVTCTGTAFPGRVATSLLRAAGLQELVTTDLAAYEALALRLATEPSFLADVRSKLAANRATCALFDTDRMRRHLEQAYATMHARSQRGEAPHSFAVG
ncbi:MAG: tetratricopeptide repeat protein [Rhodospirillales bacterium]|nr:tetratricopeptide repeat protein [Rhodospirillales bacterium]